MATPKKYSIIDFDLYNEHHISKANIYVGTLEEDPSYYISIIMLIILNKARTLPISTSQDESEVFEKAKSWLREVLGEFKVIKEK